MSSPATSFDIPLVPTDQLVSIESSRKKFRLFLIWSGIFFVLFLTGMLFWKWTHRSGDTTKIITVQTYRGPFVHEVIGRGNVESSSNVSIASEVDGKTTIMSLIPEGSWVEAGEVIAQLDPQIIESRMEIYQSWKENAPLELQTWRTHIQEYEAQLEEYLCGTVKAKRLEIEYAIAKTRNNIIESGRLATSSEELVRAGYTTDTQLEVDRIAVRKHMNSLKKSLLDRDVLLRYSSERQIVELVANIEAAKTSFEAASEGFIRIVDALKELEEQFNACIIKAPRDGRIVYANQRLRPGMTESEIIQEGASVRKGQIMFRMPDPDQMQVRALVNENTILRVKEGMKVALVFDVLRKRSFEGVVAKVSQFPELIPWDTRKRFAVLTEIKNPEMIRNLGIDLRTGLSADVRIIVQEHNDSIIIPLHALVASGEKQYCLTRHMGIWRAKEVLVGGTNASQASVIAGLNEGETIIAGAKRYLDRVTLPAADAPSEFNEQLKKSALAAASEPTKPLIPENGSKSSLSASKAKPEAVAKHSPAAGKESTGKRLPDSFGKQSKPVPVDLNDSEEQRISRHEQKIAPIKKYLHRSTIEFCLILDMNDDQKVTRDEIQKNMPELEAFFDEWDRNRNGLWEYVEIAIGLYKVRFYSGKETDPVPEDSIPLLQESNPSQTVPVPEGKTTP